MTLQTISSPEQHYSSECNVYIPTNEEKPNEPAVQNVIETSTIPELILAPASTEQHIPTTQIQVPIAYDIFYDNYGRFYYEMANLAQWGCDPTRVAYTFSQAGKLVYRSYTIPSFLAIIAQLVFHICIGIFVALFIGLPWISSGYWKYGLILGVVCTILGLILYIILVIVLSAVMVAVLKQLREKAQRITQEFLNKQIEEYYKDFGISFTYNFMLFQVYSGRGMINYYKPRILVTINAVR